MNILITSDDGKLSHGLEILRIFVKRHYKEAHTIVLTTKTEQMGKSMSITPSVELESFPLDQVENNFYEAELNPSDLIYLAFCHTQRLLSKGTFDLVFCGVNLGANVGWDVYHSGSTAMGMMAATFFNAAAFVFSQDIPQPNTDAGVTEWPKVGSEEEKFLYGNAERLLPHFLLEHDQNQPGTCLNVNFPKGTAKDWQSVGVANYSRWRNTPDLPINDRIRDDIQLLKKGYVTVSELELKVNPILR